MAEAATLLVSLDALFVPSHARIDRPNIVVAGGILWSS